MDISVHVNDVPKIAVAKEWTGANGTGTQVPPTGAIAFTSDNEAAVTVDPSTGALTYVAEGVANIAWTDDGLPDLVIASGSVSVSAAVAASGTTEFADAAVPTPPGVPTHPIAPTRPGGPTRPGVPTHPIAPGDGDDEDPTHPIAAPKPGRR